MTEAIAAAPRGRPVKVGVVLPHWSEAMDGVTPGWRDTLHIARLAEEAGFDSIWTIDELILREEEGGPLAVRECWTILSAVAASTSRVAIGPLVSCANYRNPALLALMAETIDEISGGRLILGLGAGWSEHEYRRFGFPFDHHFGRFEEALRILHSLLREGVVDFAGRYYQVRDCELSPRGPRPGRIPILVGGLSPRMLQLTASYADSWNAFIPNRSTATTVAPYRDRLEAACAEVGRDPQTLELTAAVGVCLGGRRLRFAGQDWTDGAITGSADEIARALVAFAAEGIAHLQVGLAPTTAAGIEAFVPVLEALDRSA